MNLNDLIQITKKDINYKSSLDINAILSNANTTPTIKPHLESKTLESITHETHTILSSIKYLSNEQKNTLITKLVVDSLYMFVDKLYDLHNSSYLRLIPRNPSKKQTGGILVGVKFTNIGIDILILSGRRMLQYKFDEYYIFQKLKDEELVILHINKEW